MLIGVFPFWGRRARDRLEGLLVSIAGRLDALETAPRPGPSVDQVKAALGPTLAEIAELAIQMSALADLSIDLQQKLKATNFAVSEGIERTDRAERRIHATIKRARKELKDKGFEDPGLEAEAYELRDIDGTRSRDGRVPVLPAGVEPPVEAASSIRGVSVEELQKVRGF